MKVNEIKLFENPEFGNVRTLETDDGKVMFCGTDIAKALGYSNQHDALIKHCKKDGVAICEVIDNMGRKQNAKFISEGNVYRLITHSKLPDAERFEKWVFDEVLPEIRKTGSYSLNKPLDSYMIDDPIERAKRWIEEQQEKQRLALEVQEMKPKAGYFDTVLNTPDLLSTTSIAKEYGQSAQWLNGWLYRNGVQYPQGKTWVLYQKYAGEGYTGTKTSTHSDVSGEMHSSVHTYWTQKGKKFIYDLLKKSGILPQSESENCCIQIPLFAGTEA
jgi:prophage antirepressor-like protein